MRRQRILVTRHPETMANIAGTLSGRSDVDLSAEGEDQMYRAIRAIVAWRPDRIWTSPLSRCQSIAREAANALGIPCEVNPNLAEIEFGRAQGLTLAQVRELGYDFPWQLDDEGRSHPIQGGESFEHLYARAGSSAGPAEAAGGPHLVRHAWRLHQGVPGQDAQRPLDTFWNVRIPNVSSQVVTCDDGTFRLASLGLAPEEVVRRSENPALLGRDTTEKLSGSDDE